MNKKLLIGFAVALLVTLTWVFWPSSLPERPVRVDPPDAGLVARDPREDGRSLLALAPGERPDASSTGAKREPIREPPPPQPSNDAENPLIGLKADEANPAELKEWKVPEGMTGVVVKLVDPGSPAAEAMLQKGDVIVRAQRDKISTFESLKAAVGNRDNTVLTVYRDGYPFQVVLHRPFQGEQ
jgi:S1-C subfamily serine protease